MVELSRLINKEYRNKWIVAFDPGETTGACVFHGAKLIHSSQLRTLPLTEGIDLVDFYVSTLGEQYSYGHRYPDLVVYEDYRVYGWKADTHKWADLHTPKLIGVIEAVCHYYNVPTKCRLAQQAKQFVTDGRLKEWDLWQTGQQHARDAIRHGVYQLVHGKTKKLKKSA